MRPISLSPRETCPDHQRDRHHPLHDQIHIGRKRRARSKKTFLRNRYWRNQHTQRTRSPRVYSMLARFLSRHQSIVESPKFAVSKCGKCCGERNPNTEYLIAKTDLRRAALF
jgi:stalled ribosome rescue protein Dom34